jgi:hypothetical protein
MPGVDYATGTRWVGVGVGSPGHFVTEGRRGVNDNGSFTSQQAPCGRLVGGHHYEDHDDEVVVTRETVYDCGCQSIQREYHDGSVSRRIVRHDGRVLSDKLESRT